MNPLRHPPEELWIDFVSGQLDPATRTLLDAHLGFCRDCRGTVSSWAAAGALHLAGPSGGDAVPEGLLEGILARLGPTAPPRVSGEALPLPERLWGLFTGLGKARWQGILARGFRYVQVGEGSPGLFLVHLEAGQAFPRHGHRGVERSLILAGGLRDGGNVLEAGDFDETCVNQVHTPEALPDEDCWLLASLDGTPRFQGWRGMLQRMAG